MYNDSTRKVHKVRLSRYRRRKCHAGERCELIAIEIEVTARQQQVGQRTCGMYKDNKHQVHKVRLSRLSMGEGDSHVNDAGKVTHSSDVLLI